jgi:tetratricopeptide (TPR) repeat protein
MKYPILLILALFIFMNLPLHGQKSAKLRELHQDADFFFEREDYKEAITYYLQLLDNGYDSANIRFRIGVCYLNMPGEETRSISYFEEASKDITTKYKPKEIEETKAPLHTLFYLGNAYRINNELSKALESYDKFTEHPGFFGNYNLNIVDTEIKACERAKIIQDSPVEVSWSCLDINTPSSETYPVVSGNDSVLIFMAAQKFYNAIFYCTKTGPNSWSTPVNINPEILSDGEFYPSGLSYDGKQLFLIKQSETNSDIYVSKLSKGRWTKAEKLPEEINSSSHEKYASISPDGKTLYFTSNRSSSRGGFDIYFSEKNEKGQWGKAQNMGKIINSPLDEAAPFMASDNKTFYFCSKGHFNMGGYDIFYSSMGSDKKWMEPSNIGYPINNTGDNLFYCPVTENEGYMSRITKDGKGREDIYKLNIKSKLSISDLSPDK